MNHATTKLLKHTADAAQRTARLEKQRWYALPRQQRHGRRAFLGRYVRFMRGGGSHGKFPFGTELLRALHGGVQYLWWNDETDGPTILRALDKQLVVLTEGSRRGYWSPSFLATAWSLAEHASEKQVEEMLKVARPLMRGKAWLTK